MPLDGRLPAESRHPGDGRPFVIGAGFGRTGTLSVKAALQQLLHARCYHFEEALWRPDHIDAWHRRIYEDIEIDWHSLFADYAATLDFPFCLYYREMLAAFPDAKVILTVRNPERWYASIASMLSLLNVIEWFVVCVPYGRRVMAVARYHFYGSSNGRFGGDMSKANAIRVFEQHVEEVQRNVPTDRLLIFDCTKHGWAELAQFLGVPPPPPGTPFPHLNDGMSTIRRLAWLHFRRLYLRPLVALTLAAFAAALCVLALIRTDEGAAGVVRVGRLPHASPPAPAVVARLRYLITKMRFTGVNRFEIAYVLAGLSSISRTETSEVERRPGCRVPLRGTLDAAPHGFAAGAAAAQAAARGRGHHQAHRRALAARLRGLAARGPTRAAPPHDRGALRAQVARPRRGDGARDVGRLHRR